MLYNRRLLVQIMEIFQEKSQEVSRSICPFLLLIVYWEQLIQLVLHEMFQSLILLLQYHWCQNISWSLIWVNLHMVHKGVERDSYIVNLYCTSRPPHHHWSLRCKWWRILYISLKKVKFGGWGEVYWMPFPLESGGQTINVWESLT